METAKHHCDIRMLHELAVAYKEVGTFRPERFPQSIVHGDPTQSNCLFDKDMFVAWIDWEEVGVGASLLDLALSIVSFCHCYQGPTLAVWKPEWSTHFLA